MFNNRFLCLSRKLVIRRLRKGQITLEFLLLLAVFLAFLVVWVPLIMNSKTSAEESMISMYERKLAGEIESISNELCILGNGNSREIEINSIRELEISADGKEISVDEETRETKCTTIINKKIRRGTLLLKNDDGKIIGS